MNLRLKELRSERGMTQEQAGKIIFVNQSMYSRYENGQLNLPLEAAVKFAEFYGTSVDYITGLTDIPEAYAKSSRK